MKKTLLINVLGGLFFFLIAAQSSNPAKFQGVYLGVFFGATFLNYNNYPFPPAERPREIRSTGAGPAYAIGYALTPAIAFELGALYPRKPKFLNLHGSETTARFKNNALYTAIRLRTTLGGPVGCFLKVGGGYVVRDDVVDQEVLLVKGKAVSRFVYGLGCDYPFASHWWGVLSWLQVTRSGANQLPALNFLGVGVYYLF